MPHCNKISILVFSSLPDLASDHILHQSMQESDSDCGTFSDSGPATPKAKPFIQSQLDDLIRNLALSKAAEILASRLSEHGSFHLHARITFYCKRDQVAYSFSISVKKMTLSFVST